MERPILVHAFVTSQSARVSRTSWLSGAHLRGALVIGVLVSGTLVSVTSFLRVALCAVMCAVMLSGCAAAAPDPLATPNKLTFDVTILKGDKVPFRPEAWLQPGKMIVFPDGTMLADFGPTVNTRVRPGAARVLYQRQLLEMWDVAKKLGFADPQATDFQQNPYLVEAQPNEIVYIMTFADDNDQWTFVRRFEGTGQPDPASEVWVKVMAQAAFATDLAADSDLPIRYDFGPDPYAWFRPPTPAVK